MTVRELIQALCDMPPEAEVIVEYRDSYATISKLTQEFDSQGYQQVIFS